LYIGRKKFVEAVGDGVGVNSLHHFFTEYDTMIIMRLPKGIKNRKKIISLTIKHALEQVGKPYDFDFSGKANKFFCTELVNYSFKKAGHKTKLNTIGKFKKSEKDILKKFIPASRALHPIEFAQKGNFRIIFLSHNLQFEKRITLK
jgi:hypothetical protein